MAYGKPELATHKISLRLNLAYQAGIDTLGKLLYEANVPGVKNYEGKVNRTTVIKWLIDQEVERRKIANDWPNEK